MIKLHKKIVNKSVKSLKTFIPYKILFLPLFFINTTNSYAEENNSQTNDKKEFFYTYDLNTLNNQFPTNINLVSKFFSLFPFEKSIKVNYGKGDKMAISFVDANCFDCLDKFEEIRKLGEEQTLNLTNYVFLVNKFKVNNDKLSNVNDFLWCINNREKRIKDWFEFKLNYVNKTKHEIEKEEQDQAQSQEKGKNNKIHDLSNAFILNEWIKEQKKDKFFNQHLESSSFKNCYSPIDFNTRFYQTFFSELSLPSIVFTNGLQNNLLKIGKKEFDEIFKYVEQFPQPSQIEGYEYLEDQKVFEAIKFFK